MTNTMLHFTELSLLLVNGIKSVELEFYSQQFQFEIFSCGVTWNGVSLYFLDNSTIDFYKSFQEITASISNMVLS
jgi:hypothetical protein